jgi:hypothetical protein
MPVDALQNSLPIRLGDLFSRACHSSGPLEQSYRFADMPVTVRFATPEIFDVVGRAFGHLAIDEPIPPSLTIHVWDSATTQTPSPPLPPADAEAAFGVKYYSASGSVRAHFQPSSGALSVLDDASDCAWYWCNDVRKLPDWERAASIRQILHWWLPKHGAIELHGGAIGVDGGGVLLVGKGGSGKSTTALSALAVPELKYASDDYVAVRVDPEPYVYSLYSAGKLVPDHAQRLPHLANAAANAGRFASEDKAVFYAHELFPASVVTGFPLRAILLPKITNRVDSRLVAAPATAALAALAPSTMLQLHPPGDEGWSSMAQLVRRVPCFYLELGSDIPAIPRTILRYLREAGKE